MNFENFASKTKYCQTHMVCCMQYIVLAEHHPESSVAKAGFSSALPWLCQALSGRTKWILATSSETPTARVETRLCNKSLREAGLASIYKRWPLDQLDLINLTISKTQIPSFYNSIKSGKPLSLGTGSWLSLPCHWSSGQKVTEPLSDRRPQEWNCW